MGGTLGSISVYDFCTKDTKYPTILCPIVPPGKREKGAEGSIETPLLQFKVDIAPPDDVDYRLIAEVLLPLQLTCNDIVIERTSKFEVLL